MYSKLGQHDYPRQIDTSRPIQIQRLKIPFDFDCIYCGQLKPGTNKWDGVGIEVDSDGVIKEGCWKDGNLNGFGRDIWPTGEYYIGEYKDGQRHGQGIYCWADGRKHVGVIVNNRFHGKGIEYTADGKILREGVWVDHQYI